MNKFKISAIEILKREKKPLHYKEITRLALESGILETEGATPDASMNAQITSDIKRRNNASDFIRTAQSTYALNLNKKESKEKEEITKKAKNKEIIYAIQINDFSYSSQKFLDVKIGMSRNSIQATLNRYKTGNPDAKVLDVWESNPLKDIGSCEKGVHRIAEKYALKRRTKTEKFLFLPDDYDNFTKNINFLLKERDTGLKNYYGTKKKAIKREKYTYNKRKDYTLKKPKSFSLRNNEYKVTSWTNLITRLCEQIYKKNEKDFKKVLGHSSLRGKKRPYFSKNKHELTEDNKRINGTDIYVETRFNANSIVSLCRKVLKLFNYNKDNFRIKIK